MHMLRPFVLNLLAVGFLIFASGAHAADSTFVGVLNLANEEATAKQLGLSDDVRKQLASVIDKRENEALELAMQVKGLSPEEREAKIKPFRAESETMGLKLLSEDQRKQLEKIRLMKTGLATLADENVAKEL